MSPCPLIQWARSCRIHTVLVARIKVQISKNVSFSSFVCEGVNKCPRWLFWSNDNYFEKLTLLPNNVLVRVVTSSFGSLGSTSRNKSGYVGAIVRRLIRICATSTNWELGTGACAATIEY